MGYIIEKVTGKSCGEMLHHQISKRIGLKNTYYGDTPKLNNRTLYDSILTYTLYETMPLAGKFQLKDWAGFAKGYNGPNYKINNYDQKLAAAYKKFSQGLIGQKAC